MSVYILTAGLRLFKSWCSRDGQPLLRSCIISPERVINNRWATTPPRISAQPRTRRRISCFANCKVCRRDFLKTAAAAGAAASFPAIIPASALGKDGAVAPNERVNIAAIACGGRSRVTKVYEQCNKSEVVAVCDPIRERRLKKLEIHPNAKDYSDFREVLERSDVDAVHISDLSSAVQSDMICHLSDISIRTGRAIKWDPKNETIVGDADAVKMMSRQMRRPWTL